MKKSLLAILSFTVILSNAYSQNVGIGTSVPDPSAKLDVRSTNSGVLIPRISLVSSTDIVTIPSPASSLLVYNTNTLITGGLTGVGYYSWNGSEWIRIITTDDKPITAVYYNSNNYTVYNWWQLIPIGVNTLGLSANSKFKLTYNIPVRNDSWGWGGCYIEPQVSYNNGASWFSLGSSGYDGSTMNNNSPSIGTYTNSVLVDPSISTTYNVLVRFYMRTYDGTAWINGNHDLGNVSGTASGAYLGSTNGRQHYFRGNQVNPLFHNYPFQERSLSNELYSNCSPIASIFTS